MITLWKLNGIALGRHCDTDLGISTFVCRMRRKVSGEPKENSGCLSVSMEWWREELQ